MLIISSGIIITRMRIQTVKNVHPTGISMTSVCKAQKCICRIIHEHVHELTENNRNIWTYTIVAELQHRIMSLRLCLRDSEKRSTYYIIHKIIKFRMALFHERFGIYPNTAKPKLGIRLWLIFICVFLCNLITFKRMVTLPQINRGYS